MSIVNTLSLESNSQIKINFDGGDLSSDAGLLLIKEFVSKLGIDKLFSHSFKTNDSASFRYHTDKENLLQMIYMIIAGYFEDDGRTLKELFNTSAVYSNIKGPVSVNSRYFTEDISSGLVLWSEMAKAAGVATPNIDAIITLGSTLLDEDFYESGLTLESLGFSGRSAEELIKSV